MQYNQSYSSGYPYYGPIYNSNQVVPCGSIVPEIIGEGEVVSLVLSDGTVQFYFVPMSTILTPYHHNCYPLLNSNNRNAWYIRNYPKQMPVSMFVSQRIPEEYRLPQLDCNMPSPEYKVKFHNDGWTSTTDLQYFFPRSRICDWSIPQKCNAITQIETPVANNTFCHYQIVCDRPCNCRPQPVKEIEPEKTECPCDVLKDSPMIVDPKSDKCCVSNAVHVKDAEECTSYGSSSTVKCECNEERHSDNKEKLRTYADQGCGCTSDVSCDTQSSSTKTTAKCKCENTDINKVKPEFWIPKTPLSKTAMENQSFVNKSNNDESCTRSCSSCSD